MKPIESTPVATDLERRRVLVSFIIAGAGALCLPAVASTASPEPAPTAADWQDVLQSMFPHDKVDAALYAVPAGALVAAAEQDAGTRALLGDGWRSLLAAAGGDWAGAAPEVRTRAIATLVGTPVFALLRQTTVFTFYGNPGVWAACGYEGDAWESGGYLVTGLGRIDWLPSPPADGAEP